VSSGGVPTTSALWAAAQEAASSSSALSAQIESLELAALRETPSGDLIATIRQTTASRTGVPNTAVQRLQQLLTECAARPVRIELAAAPAAAQSQVESRPTPMPDPNTLAAQNPLVQRAMDLFNAKLIKIDKH